MKFQLGMQVSVEDAVFSLEYSRMNFDVLLGIVLEHYTSVRPFLAKDLEANPSDVGSDLLFSLAYGIETYAETLQVSEKLEVEDKPLYNSYQLEIDSGVTDSDDYVVHLIGELNAFIEVPGLTAGDLLLVSAFGFAEVLTPVILRSLMLNVLDIEDVTVEYQGIEDAKAVFDFTY